IKEAFGSNFKFIESEGLAAISPPPSRGDFPVKHKGIYKTLRQLDSSLKMHFPFNAWGDHIIVTFSKNNIRLYT
ncbi:MAG TPA: hypothetical protein VIM65_14690, partial [Cyclobacteriaceae bacterium]